MGRGDANASSSARLRQLEIEMRLHRRPFAGDDAVDAGVAQRAVGRPLVAPQDAVELGTQPLDAAPACVVEKVRAELHPDAVEALEGMRQQQQLALRVDV